mmetsp:Transcript_15344/g.24872  ORF Transcript_15344/g.24872 Transcript_15344/m.24872 type:complete len:208 (-) Transcript_15344:325-948(-)
MSSLISLHPDNGRPNGEVFHIFRRPALLFGNFIDHHFLDPGLVYFFKIIVTVHPVGVIFFPVVQNFKIVAGNLLFFPVVQSFKVTLGNLLFYRRDHHWFRLVHPSILLLAIPFVVLYQRRFITIVRCIHAGCLRISSSKRTTIHGRSLFGAIFHDATVRFHIVLWNARRTITLRRVVLSLIVVAPCRNPRSTVVVILGRGGWDKAGR